ncbi:hypothetical protein H257_18429 [Aphanomyces astaci]|uniref:Uncharacterized protein n=1 Tax=Aphanomyces astaci TaxID=112090 RepID=W4FB66_APHAT|nr:hypothetical protein H257_18429 [Aphanomyces astaci]ETV64745.1 hypothetical protein H257_18429 [Aphanomyces astaci]|eukprot:XP_009845785.1 hypothetical protein H257_18429 [Aphanomyces astaci]
MEDKVPAFPALDLVAVADLRAIMLPLDAIVAELPSLWLKSICHHEPFSPKWSPFAADMQAGKVAVTDEAGRAAGNASAKTPNPDEMHRAATAHDHVHGLDRRRREHQDIQVTDKAPSPWLQEFLDIKVEMRHLTLGQAELDVPENKQSSPQPERAISRLHDSIAPCSDEVVVDNGLPY